MAPVDSHGTDAHRAGDIAQTCAVLITSLVAITAVIAVIRWARRNDVIWPYFVLLSGGGTFLMEPMFDHLYGLWFFEENQWTVIHTYGIFVPVWLPMVYIPYYGCWTTFLINRWSRGATPQDVVKLYLGSVALAATAEMFYINLVRLYNYQDHQPFRIAGYPPWVAFVNGVPPFLASLVYFRLIPKLRRREYLAILPVVPMCFAVDSFGGSSLYLAARHYYHQAPMALLCALALLTVVGSFELIRIAARLAGLDGTPTTVESTTKTAVTV